MIGSDGIPTWTESVPGLIFTSSTLCRDVTNSGLVLYGGTSGDGANIELYGSTATAGSKAYYDAASHNFRSQSAGTEYFSHDGSNFYISTGNLNMAAGSTIATVATIEMNYGRSGDNGALIDFRTDNTYTDYGFRLYRAGGANALTQIIARGTGGIDLGTIDAGNLNFYTTNSLRFYIGAGGHLYGNTSQYIHLGNQSTYYIYWDSGNSSYRTNGSYQAENLMTNQNLYLYNRGANHPPSGSTNWVVLDYHYESGVVNDIVANFNGSLYVISMAAHSDKKYKSSIADLTGVLPLIMQIQPSTYRFKDNRWDRDEIGLIAEDVEALFPTLVKKIHTGVDGEGKDISDRLLDYDRLGVIAIQGIREQQGLIADLQKRLDKLEVSHG
jgi:hypothetical protein